MLQCYFFIELRLHLCYYINRSATNTIYYFLHMNKEAAFLCLHYVRSVTSLMWPGLLKTTLNLTTHTPAPLVDLNTMLPPDLR